MRKIYPRTTLAKAMYWPRSVESVMSDNHLQEIKRYRRSYLVFWIVVSAVALTLAVTSVYLIERDSDQFEEKMREKYLTD
jgi:hypothetical protein